MGKNRTRPNKSKRRNNAAANSLRFVKLHVDAIKNTQSWVQVSFSSGAGLVGVAADMLRGRTKFTSFPKIRVTQFGQGQSWFSIDNRRLFIYKALYLNTDLIVDHVCASEEFGYKLRQRKIGCWSTCEFGLEDFRSELLQYINGIQQREPGLQHVFIRAASFSEVLASFQLVTEDREDVWFMRGSRSGLYRAKLTINNTWSTKCPEFDFFGRYATHLEITRGEECTEEEFADFCQRIRSTPPTRRA